MSQNSNRIRVFSELIGLDAWHSRLNAAGKATVFAEVNFGVARIGGDDPDFQFTFRLALRRATLEIRVERPLEIEKASIARSIPETQIMRTQLVSAKEALKGSAGAELSIDPLKLLSKLKASASAESETTKSTNWQSVEQLPPIMVASKPSAPGRYTWIMEPTFSGELSGQPWDPASEHRMKVRHPSHLPNDMHIVAELSCAREDLVISDIQRKSGATSEFFGKLTAGDLRIAAAEQQIRKVLSEADLEPGAIDNRFASLILGSAIAVVNDE